MDEFSVEQLRAVIERLAAIDRASCSNGEHQAAEWIADALRSEGATASVEHERVHGTYWWPLGISAAAGIFAAALVRRGHRFTGSLLASAATATVVDELAAGRRWLRRVLPKQLTANVVAQAGDREAARTLVLVAHHDAAHTSVFFDPRITTLVARRSQPAPGAPPQVPPGMAPLAVAPGVIAVAAVVNARRVARLGGWICMGIIASFTEIALRKTVPGANDNLTGVATLVGVARELNRRPIRGLNVLLLSTGAEESLMEGMRAFATRHFPMMRPELTNVLCVDTVGSPHLVLAEAEGMLRMRDYDREFNELIAAGAAASGIRLRRGFRVRVGTDGLIALRHGFPAAMLTSVDDHGAPSNYHWPTDTPDRVDYERLMDTVRLCGAVARALAGEPG